MYHDIIARRDNQSLWFDCSADEFEKQMAWLKQNQASPISLADFYAHLAAGKPIPPKSVVITFDDNYQGFWDHALPILRKYGYPAAIFVHTGFVGDRHHGRPKMSWEELQTLVKDPLVTIGSHTVSHPDDITKLDVDKQQRELEDSKADLEKHLGIKIEFLAYPDGKNDKGVQLLSKASGYKLAFTVANGPAEESPNIFAINRYVHTRLEKAWDDCDHSRRGGALGVVIRPLVTSSPVAFKEGSFASANLALVSGGAPSSVMSLTREGVLDFVHRTSAVAGINGGFFAMAAIDSTDNRMVGPCKVADAPSVTPDDEVTRWPKLLNRPVVMWGPQSFAIFPYVPEQMASDDDFKAFMPDVTDVFLAGVWLVHEGQARSEDDMNIFSSKDIQDPRRRAFLGIKSDGTFVIGASKDSCSSSKLAEAIAAAGIQEAVLLDSGFSTSLVYGEKIMASGHSTSTTPSRPVPHAIVIRGSLDPASQAAALAAIPATDPIMAKGHRRRTRKSTPAPPSVDVSETPVGPGE